MSKPTGRRKVTPAINAVHLCAEHWGRQTAIEKARAVLAFNSASHLLKLNAHAIQLMNTLLSYSRKQDWDGDSRPLVWPSNEDLVAQCTFERASLHRNLRRLAEAGLIAFKDSPKGNRVGVRTKDGSAKIILSKSYGIDLSPLGLKTPELEELVTADKHRIAETRKLAREFTCLRKMIASVLDAAAAYDLAGPWEAIEAKFQMCISQRRRSVRMEALRELLGELESLKIMAQEAFHAATAERQLSDEGHQNVSETEMTPMGITSDTLIQNTTETSKVDLYGKWKSAEADQLEFADTGYAGENGFGKKPVRQNRRKQEHVTRTIEVDPKTLLSCCPVFKEHVLAPHGAGWSEIVNVAENVVSKFLEVPDTTWRTACRILGRARAACAIALIFEKFQAGLVKCPGAYLNGMIAKEQEGRLSLSASLFYWKRPAPVPLGNSNRHLRM